MPLRPAQRRPNAWKRAARSVAMLVLLDRVAGRLRDAWSALASWRGRGRVDRRAGQGQSSALLLGIVVLVAIAGGEIIRTIQ